MTVRPTPDQVLALVADRRAAAAATETSDPAAWSAAGHDDDAVWGRYIGTTAEPYDVAVELHEPAFRCSCPSRQRPCKHALGLLLLHARSLVAPARRPEHIDAWVDERARRRAAADAPTGPSAPSSDPAAPTDPQAAALTASDAAAPRSVGEPSARSTARPGAEPDGTSSSPEPTPERPDRSSERLDRMRAGVLELDRWLADRVRVGLAAAELSDPATWDRAAARLVDAQCGGLANRVRRVAGRVGRHADWYDDVLAELAVLHALAQGALRAPALPDDLADGVQVAAGLSTRQADVLAGVPTTARWLVVGESRAREDRITVQRTWLRSIEADAIVDGRPRVATWAMLLSFGAFGRELVSPLPVGAELEADVHWYPGAQPLRGLLGMVHAAPVASSIEPASGGVAAAVAEVGRSLAVEPWLERVPMCLRAAPVPSGEGRWSLADVDGAVPLDPGFMRLAELVAVSGGGTVTVAGEWSADGLLPLTVWAPASIGRSVAVVL